VASREQVRVEGSLPVSGLGDNVAAGVSGSIPPRATLSVVATPQFFFREVPQVPADPSKNVRVLQVIRPAVGGMKGHMLQLAAGLASLGFATEVACPAGGDVAIAAAELGIPVHAVAIVGPLDPLRDPVAVAALARVIRDGRPDLVHAHGFKAALIARLAARRAGRVPVIVTVHNHVLYRGISRFTRWRYIFVERWLSRMTARVITVSDSLRDELVEQYGIDPALITTVHNGLDLAPFLAGPDRAAARVRRDIPLDALVFGIAARFAPQKAMDVLVDAAVPVLDGRRDAWLLLAGDGPMLEAVRSQAAASSASDRIVFPGFERDVPALLSALDVYVSSALSEGLPLATIEAMAAGLPVVSTRAGGTPEVVEDGVTGLLVEPGSAAGLSQAMSQLAGDADVRRSMGEAGRARARAEFSEERMLQRTAAVYREVLA
jgi:glycosyltransferase involved in cell wall biosynthesis